MEAGAEISTTNDRAKRRSLRLAMKLMKKPVEHSVSSECYLEALPSHVIATIFDCLSVRDIGVFTLVSTRTRTLVENYMKCRGAKKRFHLYNQHKTAMSVSVKSDLMIHFQQFGILMKRATCLYNTDHRLQIVVDEVFSLLNCNVYCHHECLPEDCPCLPLFGRFLQSLTIGWDYNEWVVVLCRLQEASCILGCLQAMFNSGAGTQPHVEMRVRHFYRSVLLTDYHSSYDLAFCLAKILENKSIIQKAHLMFVLYGPCKKKGLSYYEMCEVMPPLNPSEMQIRFADLANAINMLHFHKLMPKETVFAILRSIKGLPEDWLALNYANLLISLDEKLLVLFLGHHARNGLLPEVGGWIVLMAMITNKYVRNMDWIVDVLGAIFKMLRTSNERFKLMKCIQDAFHSEIAEFHDSSAFELDEEINFNLMLSAAMQFNKCFFKKHLHQGLFKS